LLLELPFDFLYTDSMKNKARPFDGPITKDGLMLQRHLKKGDGFVRLISPSKVAQDIKEARRVGYLVEKDNISFYVNDDETGDIVMMGIRVNRSFYACTFSRKYWEEPPLVVTAQELEDKRITREQLDKACTA
jgi:hypothetical protein